MKNALENKIITEDEIQKSQKTQQIQQIQQIQQAQKQRDEFVANNLGLVHLCARRFKNKGIEYDDLYSAGCVGLVKAYDGFDWDRGVQFSTYAVPVILGEVKRLFRDGGALKVSRGLKELSMKVVRARENFMKTQYREPTVSELATMFEISNEEIVEALNVSTPPMSLTIDTDEDSEIKQVDVKVESEEENISNMLALKSVIGKLEVRDRKLIVYRYFQNKTQTQTALLLEMTQVQVSRREKKILAMLRKMLSE